MDARTADGQPANISIVTGAGRGETGRSRGGRHGLANCSPAQWLIDPDRAGYLTQMAFTGVHPGRDATASAVSGPAGAAPPAALAAMSLSKRFGSRLVVDQVSFSAGAGRIHGLLGSNGAGKTTTLRMLLGVVRPDSGAVRVRGVDLRPDVPRGLCGIAGFVESPRFYPYLTASRNLELLSAWDGPSAHRRVEELLESVGLAGRAQSKVRGFSTGMTQRLGLAAALISDPQILLVDEPTSGLDPAGIRDLHAVLAGWAAAGRTVVLSSHDLAEVEQLCTDVTVLRAGRVAYSGTLTGLREQAPSRSWRLRTSDDPAAVAAAGKDQRIDGTPGPDAGGLTIVADPVDLDRYVLALGAGGIAVRELKPLELPLESLFFQLTEAPEQRTADRR